LCPLSPFPVLPHPHRSDCSCFSISMSFHPTLLPDWAQICVQTVNWLVSPSTCVKRVLFKLKKKIQGDFVSRRRRCRCRRCVFWCGRRRPSLLPVPSCPVLAVPWWDPLAARPGSDDARVLMAFSRRLVGVECQLPMGWCILTASGAWAR